MFVYIRNSELDAPLSTFAGTAVVPVGWWWERLGTSDQSNDNYVLFALSLMFTFFAYLIVSVVELVAWIFYMTGDLTFARMYFTTVGYWGSIVGYALPCIFIILHIGIEQPKSADIVFPQAWSCYILAFSLLWWLGFGYLHMIEVPKFAAHIDARLYYEKNKAKDSGEADGIKKRAKASETTDPLGVPLIDEDADKNEDFDAPSAGEGGNDW